MKRKVETHKTIKRNLTNPMTAGNNNLNVKESETNLHNKRQCPSRKTINNFFLGGKFLEINF
jgi:hypothetical protein